MKPVQSDPIVMPQECEPNLNVVPLAAKHPEFRAARAMAGSDDPRTREAMRLVEAFLAIEDATARESLIALAERLVSYDWLRKVQPR